MIFSVIIPIYNSEMTLRKCLESVEEQSFPDFEVLMINDGSTDHCEEICRSFQKKDSRFHYYYQENQGVSTARNLGIDSAEGEYIVFLDSDDFYYDDYLDSFYNMILEYPQAGHYWCAFEEYDGAYTPKRIYTWGNGQAGIVNFDRKLIMALHMQTLDGSPWNKVYRRNLLTSLRMQPNLSLGEDWLFNLNYLDQNPNTDIILQTKPKYGYYCASANSLDHKYRENLESVFKQLLDCLKEYLTVWEVDNEQWGLFYLSAFYMLENAMRNYFRKECQLSIFEKYRRCNLILKNKLMQKCLQNEYLRINKLYLWAYRTRNYVYIRLLDKLVFLKYRLMR